MQKAAPEGMHQYEPLRQNKQKIQTDTDNNRKDCNRKLPITLGTWNVRSLHQAGKLENVLQEMSRMNIDVLGVAETFYDGAGDFEATLPATKENFRIIYSGSDKKRKGVAFILAGASKTAVQSHQAVSDRIVCIRLKAKPVDMLVVQVYAPTNDSPESEVEEFYEQLDSVMKSHKKYKDCVVIMGDLNGKVGNIKEEDIVGPYGIGQRNENGQRLIDCCRRHNLMIANTWYQCRQNARHTWTAPDGKTRNQIDYIMMDKRYRNGVKNCKARPGADCGSDHNPVIAELDIKLHKIVNNNKDRTTRRWNTDILKQEPAKRQFEEISDGKFQNVVDTSNTEMLWSEIKSCITATAEQVCGKYVPEKRQQWMTTEILQKMEERRQYKEDKSEYGLKKYKELKHEIQKLCRHTKNKHLNEKCAEIERLEASHNPLLYKKIKELTPKQHISTQTIKDKDGNLLSEPEKILERWAQYVEELYNDSRCASTHNLNTQEVCTISEMEVKAVIQKLTRNKATGSDNIPAEFLQTLGEKGLQIITKLMNRIYNTGNLPDDFLQTVFITIPKKQQAQECADFRTISLISHTSKILLHLINARITPIIERHLSDTQMGFRKGRGTKDAIFQLRTIIQRCMQFNKRTYTCFVDYQKAFDRINHDKLLHIMEKAGIPDLERNLIKSLYWNQYAVIKTADGKSRRICIRRGVRQGCIISPILFNLYTEYMMKEFQDEVKGIKIGGQNFTNFRYADDAVFVSDEEAELQNIVTKVDEVCKDYGMEMNVKKTKTMAFSKTGKVHCKIVVNGTTLEQVSQYKYLGSWITEDGRCEMDTKTRIAMAKDAFWKHKELLRGNINLQVKKRMLHCYVFPVLKYSCESWTMNKDLSRRINAFEQWCYRRLLKIKWTDKVLNTEVLRRIKEDEMRLYRSIQKQKMAFAGHVLRGSSGESALQILEGQLEASTAKGRPRRMWLDDIGEWTKLDTYEKIKRLAQDRRKWRNACTDACQPSDPEDDN